MDSADHYLGLVKLGYDVFITSAAPAALVRTRPGAGNEAPRAPTGTVPPIARASSAADAATAPPPAPVLAEEVSRESTVDLELETALGDSAPRRRARRLEIYPLLKKPNAPFPDMITVGRTPNNDIVLKDATVSRLHAFFRFRDGRWYVADGGSKNGTFLDGHALAPRKERELAAGQIVKVGDLEVGFYTVEALFKMLSAIA